MVIRYFRIFYRLLFNLLLVIFYILASGLINILFPVCKYRKKSVLSKLNSFCASVFLLITGIRVNFTGLDYYDKSKTWFVMANHISYVDVLAVVKKINTLLITSTELRKRGILGLISILAGSLYVDRRKVKTIKNEIPEISEAFRKNINVCIFPEATTSNGEGLLPFKSGLMGAVSGTGADILPVCIMYKKINRRKFTVKDFSTVGYFGGVKFAPQFLKLLMIQSLEVEAAVLEPVEVLDKDRKELASDVFKKINSRYLVYLEEIRNNP